MVLLISKTVLLSFAWSILRYWMAVSICRELKTIPAYSSNLQILIEFILQLVNSEAAFIPENLPVCAWLACCKWVAGMPRAGPLHHCSCHSPWTGLLVLKQHCHFTPESTKMVQFSKCTGNCHVFMLHLLNYIVCLNSRGWVFFKSLHGWLPGIYYLCTYVFINIIVLFY